MFKIAGLVCITAAAGAAGIIRSMVLKERVQLLEEFLQLIMNIRGRINYFREPLTLLQFSEGKTGDMRAFFFIDEILCDLRQKDLEIKELWAQKAEEIYGCTALKREDIDLIIYMGSFIGQTDYENQIAHFEYLEKSFEKRIKEAREEYMVKGPLYRKTGFFAGGIISLVFL